MANAPQIHIPRHAWVINGLNDGAGARVFTSRHKALDYAIAAAGPVHLNVEDNFNGYEVSSEQAYLTIERVELNPKAEWDGYC
tara:strand:- start:113 stop:361 length:249 start_codon:yes stop_codon:yes gene_type:complete